MSDIADQAVDLANEVEVLCRGRPTASVYIALSMMIGGAAGMAPRPDFEGCMELVMATAREEFDRTRSRSN